MLKLWKRGRKNQGTATSQNNHGKQDAVEQAKKEATTPPPLKGDVVPLQYETVVSLQTDLGCIREVNEDHCLYMQPDDPAVLESKGALYIIADGMGGHSAGEVASKMAVETVCRAYYASHSDAMTSLQKAFDEANRKIHEASIQDKSLRGMGTTCTALVLHNDSALSAHVGDSRLYLVRDKAIYLLTEDHSQVREMVKQGLIRSEEARHHPDKNVILRALGSHAQVEISTWQGSLRSGDKLILCSDGLHDLVEDKEIEHITLSANPHLACQQLIALARERGGYDNITVGIIELIPLTSKEQTPIRQTREVKVTE